MSRGTGNQPTPRPWQNRVMYSVPAGRGLSPNIDTFLRSTLETVRTQMVKRIVNCLPWYKMISFTSLRMQLARVTWQHRWMPAYFRHCPRHCGEGRRWT